MNIRKTCPVPILDMLDRYREANFGSRKDLAAKMTVDWGEEWSKEKLDDLFQSTHEPRPSTISKIAISLGWKFFRPEEFIPVVKED